MGASDCAAEAPPARLETVFDRLRRAGNTGGLSRHGHCVGTSTRACNRLRVIIVRV